jgi:hypothetical protein
LFDIQSEMTSLKADNERLQRIIYQRGIDPSHLVGGRVQALESEISPESTNRLSLTELVNSAPGESEIYTPTLATTLPLLSSGNRQWRRQDFRFGG